MKIIGITGPTGAGKTTALNALTALGACVIDADAVYHRLLEESAPLREALIARFGDICDASGKIDRKKLGNVVFTDPAALAELNAITHPAVKAEVCAWLRRAEAAGLELAAIDAVGLQEGGLMELCQRSVAVTAPLEARVARLAQRDGISPDYARLRIAAGKSDEAFAAGCDDTLCNDCLSPADFEKKCAAYLDQIPWDQIPWPAQQTR